MYIYGNNSSVGCFKDLRFRLGLLQLLQSPLELGLELAEFVPLLIAFATHLGLGLGLTMRYSAVR